METINTHQNIKVIFDKIQSKETITKEEKSIIFHIINKINNGQIRAAEKINGSWEVNEIVKKAILLLFYISENKYKKTGDSVYHDKIPLKFQEYTEEQIKQHKIRIVNGAIIRYPAHIEDNVVVMPSFINSGAYIGSNSMIDTWATIGSCAQIGKNCHISGGAGIGGVLEPINNRPTIIEDNCFIGARSEVVDGMIVGEGSVIGMGVFISPSTKIVNRETGEITYGKIPPNSVVIAGSIQDKHNISIYCAIIIKKVDESTKSKTSINEILRY